MKKKPIPYTPEGKDPFHNPLLKGGVNDIQDLESNDSAYVMPREPKPVFVPAKKGK
jgi:hypothetical protein